MDEYDETAETGHYVAYIARNAVPKAMTLKEVELATSQDQPPSNVSLAELSRYENVKNELTCTYTVLLKSNRIVVPATLQNKTVEIAHEGHLGIVKTKALMRQKV